jgi:hypothetical protein
VLLIKLHSGDQINRLRWAGNAAGTGTGKVHHHHHHHHLVLQPYVSLGLLCYSPPLVPILSFSSPEEKCIQAFGENLRERDHLEDPGVDGRSGLVDWTGSMWLRIRQGGRLL